MYTKNLFLNLVVLLLSCPPTISFMVALTTMQRRIHTSFSMGEYSDEGSNIDLNGPPMNEISRREVLRSCLSSFVILGGIASMATGGAQYAEALPGIPDQKSYSSNARNLDRLSIGDSSGGSVYDNNPASASARKRRAMVGCKIDSSRKEASTISNMEGQMSEKDCNIRVMSGDTDFMLEALRKLDCPTCPYGIDGA